LIVSADFVLPLVADLEVRKVGIKNLGVEEEHVCFAVVGTDNPKALFGTMNGTGM
jgi:hypothetical protein